jgi:predicted nucleic acid-binding Zn ribbon protein
MGVVKSEQDKCLVKKKKKKKKKMMMMFCVYSIAT